MRGTQCNRDTFKVAGNRKLTKRKMLFFFVKKLLHINSPSIAGVSGYEYEYDYLKSGHIGGKKNG